MHRKQFSDLDTSKKNCQDNERYEEMDIAGEKVMEKKL
jgi:hypothetical protein